MGRALDNAVLNLDMREQYKAALDGLGFTFEDLLDYERDAGLGCAFAAPLPSLNSHCADRLPNSLFSQQRRPRTARGLLRRLVRDARPARMGVRRPCRSTLLHVTLT